MSKFKGIFLVVLFLCTLNMSFGVQRGSVQYSIPTDYSKINEAELSTEAENLFQAFLTSEDPKQRYIILNQLLSDYSILGEINKDNPLYFARLGIVFDKLGKDRYAISNFSRSANILPDYPYAYYSFGNFYFDRGRYIKALKLYKKAYDSGYDSHFYNIYQIGRIYEKFGDFSSAILYYKRALVFNDSPELRQKILELEELLNNNSLYNLRRGEIEQ
ncbi:MAG: tetratricopeptide repeat protein [Cyanobacteria bacterium RUI128]|nr:tetratricopeptide repeat protein [Cyanobacteria bacterium RUI128]